MGRDWIDEGLGREREREAQQHRESERRHRDTAILRENGPEFMRRLVAEIRAAIEEYRLKAPAGRHELEFEELPHQGFCVSRTSLPKAGLECHPDYEAHMVHCTETHADDPETDPTERLFSLNLMVNESGNLALRTGTRTFQTMDEAAEAILTPVLFPLLGPRLPM
jgi:hypothetical protein